MKDSILTAGEVLCTIGNHNRNENSLRWLYLTLKNGVDSYIIDSGSDVRPVGPKERIIERDNIYWGGIFAETVRLTEEKKPKYVLHVDDDILITDDDANKLFERIKKIIVSGKIGIYQPSTESDSHNVFKENINAGTNDIRPTGTIEEWMYLAKSDVILKTKDYKLDFAKEVKHGWGFGYLLCKASSDLGYANVVDDYLTVKHPTGPATYNVGEAMSIMGRMNSKLSIDTGKIVEDCKKVNSKFDISTLL